MRNYYGKERRKEEYLKTLDHLYLGTVPMYFWNACLQGRTSQESPHADRIAPNLGQSARLALDYYNLMAHDITLLTSASGGSQINHLSKVLPEWPSLLTKAG